MATLDSGRDSTINVLIETFSGLCLPRSLCIPLPRESSTDDLFHALNGVLPSAVISRASLSTTDNRAIAPSRKQSLHDVANGGCGDYNGDARVLPLRVSVPLLGGKGGFGSQLRAAGGRMSSRKKRQNAELATGSARNLDGRRLRTVTEAKNLATYLATKPEMDRKEKEERRKRWQHVIDLAEQREEDMKAGKAPDGRRKGLSEEWIEAKEEVNESVKNAVRLAMSTGEADSAAVVHESDQSAKHSSEEISDEEDVMELEEDDMGRLRAEAEAGDADALWVLQHRLKIPQSLLPAARRQALRFADFDEDDEDSSDEDA